MARRVDVPTATGKVASAATRVGPWRAVSIEPGPAGCTATRALDGMRFLSPRAPLLPLAECSSKAACRCFYKRYVDRRQKPRRREELHGQYRAGIVALERRTERDRRHDDFW